MSSKTELENSKKLPQTPNLDELPDVDEVAIETENYSQPAFKPGDLDSDKLPESYKQGAPVFTTGFTAAEKLYRTIKGEQVPSNEYSILETGVVGVLDASLKIAKNAYTLTGAIVDALGEENIKKDAGLFAKLERDFDESVFGKIERGAEEIAYQDAVGRLTSAFTQLYVGGRFGASGTLYLGNKAKQIANNYIKAAKVGKVAKPNKNMVKALEKAKELNKLSGKNKYIAIGIGGGVGAGIVAETEDIGTLGDIEALNELIGFDFPTRLDRVKREDAKDEAVRNLTNRFKFGADTGLISVVVGYGLGKVTTKLIEQGDQLAYSNKAIDRWIDRFAADLRPRGFKEQKLFEGTKKVEGQINAGQVTSKDLILDIDKTLFDVAKRSGISKGSPSFKRIIGRVDELLTGGEDVVKNNKIIFNGFDTKTMKEFKKFADEIGITANDQKAIVSDLIKIRNEFNVFKNALLTSKNLNVGSKQFNEIMSDRMKNMFTSEYKIATDRSILPWANYKPAEANVNAVKSVIDRYGKSEGVKLADTELDLIVDDIIKNVQIDEVTKTPRFFMTKLNALDDTQTQLINIADSFKKGVFKPGKLIKTKDDLRDFQRLFGQKRDIRNTIINTINDLASIVAKDELYSNVLKNSEELIKQGKRAVVYPTRLQAIKNLPNQQLITSKNGLQIKSPLGESAYTNPLNGYFTSKKFADALQFAEKIPFDEFAKNAFYKHLVLIPKGATQISKTILGPFTHTRNFVGSSIFAMASGNVFKNPITVVKNFKQAFNTVQPQLLYRNLPKDQAMYKFLLEEQVVNSSAVARDIAGVLDDIGKGGDVYQRFFGKFGQGLKNLYTKAGDLYVAEDDLWKIFSFLGDFDSYKKAYTAAFNAGKIKQMPSDLELMKTAANLVRNYMPNYGYVGRLVQAVRRLPLGNFLAWPAEILRNGVNLIEIALKEAKNPITAGIGYKRLASAATTIGIAIPVIGEITRNLYGITKDMAAAAREFVPYYSKESIIFLTRDEDGSLNYIDASGAFVYDTLTNPITAALAAVEEQRVIDPSKPLIPGLYEGLARGMSRLARPFIEPSIWYATMLDILVRDGETKEGYRIWNEDAPQGEKIAKAVEYTIEATAPLSFKQFKRLGSAIQDKPGPRGEKFDVDDEIAGFYGLRGVKLDPMKSMPYKIYEFKKSVAGTRSLLTSPTTKGGEISRDDIIERYYIANQQRFKAMRKQKNINELARILEVDEDAMKKLYVDRGIRKEFNFMNEGEYLPFKISPGYSKKVREQREKLEEQFEQLTFEAPLDEEVLQILNEMKQDMTGMSLEDRYQDQIRLEDYLTGEKRSSSINDIPTPPLPEQPQPNPQIVSTPPMPMQSGLTTTENALLSDEEKAIRLRQRGVV